jgi:hypothetical protein
MTLPSKNHTLLVPVAYLIIEIPFGFSLHSLDLLKTIFSKAFMSQACEKVSVLNFVVHLWTPSNLKGVQRIPQNDMESVFKGPGSSRGMVQPDALSYNAFESHFCHHFTSFWLSFWMICSCVFCMVWFAFVQKLASAGMLRYPTMLDWLW